MFRLNLRFDGKLRHRHFSTEEGVHSKMGVRPLGTKVQEPCMAERPYFKSMTQISHEQHYSQASLDAAEGVRQRTAKSQLSIFDSL